VTQNRALFGVKMGSFWGALGVGKMGIIGVFGAYFGTPIWDLPTAYLGGVACMVLGPPWTYTGL
jgi:hypothetical protein